jgi:hypothetical protein
MTRTAELAAELGQAFRDSDSLAAAQILIDIRDDAGRPAVLAVLSAVCQQTWRSGPRGSHHGGSAWV